MAPCVPVHGLSVDLIKCLQVSFYCLIIRLLLAYLCLMYPNL